jgi:hypothetical protein
MRRSPSTIAVSLENALRLSFARVLARLPSKRLRSLALASVLNSRAASSTSIRAY